MSNSTADKPADNRYKKIVFQAAAIIITVCRRLFNKEKSLMMTGVAVFMVLLVGYVFFYNQLAKLDALSERAWKKLKNSFSRREELSGKIKSFMVQHFPDGKFDDIFIPFPTENNDDDIRRRLEFENRLSRNMSRLLARTAADDNQEFCRLRQEWKTAEKDMQNARRRYNAAVRDYNVALHTFPASVVGKSIKAKEKIFFKIDRTEPKQPEKSDLPDGQREKTEKTK